MLHKTTNTRLDQLINCLEANIIITAVIFGGKKKKKKHKKVFHERLKWWGFVLSFDLLFVLLDASSIETGQMTVEDQDMTSRCTHSTFFYRVMCIEVTVDLSYNPLYSCQEYISSRNDFYKICWGSWRRRRRERRLMLSITIREDVSRHRRNSQYLCKQETSIDDRKMDRQ